MQDQILMLLRIFFEIVRDQIPSKSGRVGKFRMNIPCLWQMQPNANKVRPVTQSLANELGLVQAFPCRKVTLNVHSSLDAVGFLAAITTRLAQKLNLGVNPVSGYYHDHLFVPKGKEDLVVKEIETMAAEQE